MPEGDDAQREQLRAELSADEQAGSISIVAPVPVDVVTEPPPAVDYAPGTAPRWQAGTLAYTSTALIALFIFLLGGDFTWSLRDRALGPSMPLLLRKFGGSDFAAGILLGFLPAALGMVLAPIVSYRSDRHRGRFGRRIPFLLISTPFAVVAMIGLAFTPQIGAGFDRLLGAHSPGRQTCDLAVFATLWTMFELAAITCNAVHGALINDVVPRPVLGKFFGFFRMLSLIAGMIYSWYLLGVFETHYVEIFMGIALLYGVCFSVMCFKVKEGEYPPPPETPEWAKRSFFGPFQHAMETYFRDCFTKPYYLWFFFSFALAHMAFTPINLYSTYFAQSVNMSMATYGKFSALQLLCSLIQAPIVGWLADKVHPIRLTMIALGLYGVVTFAAFLYVHDSRSFAIAHVVCGTVSGFWLTSTAPLAQVLLPRMKFATFASALGIFTALGTALTAPIMGRILDHLNGAHTPANARDYHTIYLWASCFVILSLSVTVVVYHRFKQQGGPWNYVAPE
jgi:MFS family permease